MREQAEQLRPALSRLRCSDWYHVDLEAPSRARAPRLAHRIALDEAQEPVALVSAQVEADRAGSGSLEDRQQHEGPQRLVAALRIATPPGKRAAALINGFTICDRRAREAGLSRFFFRPEPAPVRSFGGALTHLARPTGARRSAVR